jgi:hypothetical protein
MISYIVKPAVYVGYILLAVVFWILESLGWFSIEVIDKKYKYVARGVSILFSGFMFWWVFLSDGAFFPIEFLRPQQGEVSTEIVSISSDINEECTPYNEYGCTFDFKSKIKRLRHVDTETGHKHLVHTISINDRVLNERWNLNDLSRYKVFTNFPCDHASYSIAHFNHQVYIKGDVFDFKYGKLGWFNEEKMKVDKFDGKKCAYTFCLDDRGVEIYNIDYNIAFSFTRKEEDFYYRYAGSFVHNDIIYVNDGQSELGFASMQEAEEFRSKTKPIFDFRDRDSTGRCKRLMF